MTNPSHRGVESSLYPAAAFVRRRLPVALTHAALWALAFAAAYVLRFDGLPPTTYRAPAVYGLFTLLAIRSASFWFSGLFHGVLRYAGLPEVRAIVRATTISTLLFVVAGALERAIQQPRSIYAGEWALAILAASGFRIAIRVLREGRRRVAPTGLRRALVIGAGDAGEMLLRDLDRNPQREFTICGIIDDDPTKQGNSVRGIRVLGPATELILQRAREDLEARLAILAMPSASGARIREIVSACRAAGLETKTLPSLQQILSGDIKISMLRDVAIEDLLRREPIHLDERSMATFLRGKRVLVTGAAGSIGSELVRQALHHEPAALIGVDHNENGLFFLERELRAAYPRKEIAIRIADIKDSRRVAELYRTHRPHVVLHAAAHKHVPLMETNPAEAIKNNVFGTRIMADLADAFGIETFVLISTDKAVNPTSVMGATKRIAEMYLQSLSGRTRSKLVAVRFGNVLGSAGSVVPVFREQIAGGGPVTVTHPDMRRYFMTIPEATQLVLQAGALAEGGEIFVLDMGEPVRIVDLARDMIRMSGFEPDVDIPIVFSGKRPGEKLFEELLHASEGYDRTVHSKIMVGRIAPVAPAAMQDAMRKLADCIDGSPEDIRSVIASIVPEATLSGLPSYHEQLGETLRQLQSVDTLQAHVVASQG